MAKTNTEMLRDSFNRASNEGFMIYNCGGVSSDKIYIVINKSNEKAYNITVVDNKVTSCDCPHHTYRKIPCKHMIKIAEEKKLDIVL